MASAPREVLGDLAATAFVESSPLFRSLDPEALRDLVLEHVTVHPAVRHTETHLVFVRTRGQDGFADVTLDAGTMEVRRSGVPVEVTTQEFKLLEFFMRHPGQVLTRQQILDYVWSYERDVQSTMVDVYVSYLRRKLNAPGERDPIRTVRGVGYRFVDFRRDHPPENSDEDPQVQKDKAPTE